MSPPVSSAQRVRETQYGSALSDRLVDHLARLVPFLLALFILMEIAGFWLWPQNRAEDLFRSDTTAILILIGIQIFLIRRQVRGIGAHISLILVAYAALLKNVAAIFWLQEPYLSFNTMLILLIAGSLAMNWGTFLIIGISVYAAWIGLALTFVPPAEYLGIWSALLISGCIATLILGTRLSLMKNSFDAQWNLERQSDQLSEALARAQDEIRDRQKAERSLEEVLEQQRGLNRLTIATRGILEFPQLLESLLREVSAMTGAHRVWFVHTPTDTNGIRKFDCIDTDQQGVRDFSSTSLSLTSVLKGSLDALPSNEGLQVIERSVPNAFVETIAAPDSKRILLAEVRPTVGDAGLLGIEFDDDIDAFSDLQKATIHQIRAYMTSAFNSARLHGHIQQVQSRLRNVFNHLEEGIFEMDGQGQVVMVSPSMQRLIGKKEAELVGTDLLNYLPPEAGTVLRSAMEEIRKDRKTRQDLTCEIPANGTSPRVLNFSLTPLLEHSEDEVSGFLGLVSDITLRRREEEEREQFEEQLRRSQQLEALGTLAGGVAHDFNNLLTGILGQAQMIELESDPESRIRNSAEIIEKAAERGAQLTSQLLGFARQGKIQSVAIDLSSQIQDTIDLLRRTLDRNIQITFNDSASEATILGDPGQIQSVLINLALNARDAMPNGGTLNFNLSTLPAENNPAWAQDLPASGSILRLEISDTGKGIPAEIADRVFEPFFTTKPDGEGSGMGLAMTYGTVLHHGGQIRFDCPETGGTIFTLEFPAITASMESADKPLASSPHPGEGETLLVVDDEEIVRGMFEQMLQAMNFKVLLARDGEEGIELYKAHRNEVRLVIVDMIMPGMNGLECYLALRELNPDVRVILSSGYSRESRAQEMLAAGASDFLQKPFRFQALADAVHGALSRGREGSGIRES